MGENYRRIVSVTASPEAVSASTGVSLDEMYRRGQHAYLAGRADRKAAGFRSLWLRWAGGGCNMPMSVEAGFNEDYMAALGYREADA